MLFLILVAASHRDVTSPAQIGSMQCSIVRRLIPSVAVLVCCLVLAAAVLCSVAAGGVAPIIGCTAQRWHSTGTDVSCAMQGNQNMQHHQHTQFESADLAVRMCVVAIFPALFAGGEAAFVAALLEWCHSSTDGSCAMQYCQYKSAVKCLLLLCSAQLLQEVWQQL